MIIAKIDEETLTADDFVKVMKLNNTFDNLIEDLIKDKLTIHAAKKHGLRVSIDDVQERADQIRRVLGLHRAKDTLAYLEGIGVTLDEFESYITDTLYKEKMLAELNRDEAVKEYFQLNSPKFESIEISHIIVDSEGKAKEMLSVLSEDPESFAEMAREYSLATDTKDSGGLIGKIYRGSLPNEVEAKIFNASPGDLLGPFPSVDGNYFELFKVNAKHPAILDDSTTKEVQKLIHEEWLQTCVQEHSVEIL